MAIFKWAIATQAYWDTMDQSGYQGYYTTISAWNNAQRGFAWATNGDTPVAECFDVFGGPLLDRVVMNNWTDVDDVYHPIVTVADGHWHDGDINAGFAVQASSDITIFPWTTVELRRLRIIGGTVTCIQATDNNDIRLTAYNIICSGAGGIGINCGAGIYVKLRNSIVHSCGGRGIVGIASAGNLVYCDNCLVDSCSDIGFLRVHTHNCVSVGHSLGDFWESVTLTDPPYTNASQDTSAPGTDSITGVVPTDIWTDYGTKDYSLKSGSDLIGSGSDLSMFMEAIDIKELVRTIPWDIGPYKETSIAPPTVFNNAPIIGAAF